MTTSPSDKTPATEAGRRLLAEGDSWHLSKVPFPVNAAAILAIEAEARADALREAADQVRALPGIQMTDAWVWRESVLAVLTEQEP